MPQPNNNNKVHEEKVNDEENHSEKDKHRWDAADLEKVTDYHDDKDEMNEISYESLGNLKATTNPEIKRILIRKEDINLIVDQLEVLKSVAEQKLFQHEGDVKAAMRDIIGF